MDDVQTAHPGLQPSFVDMAFQPYLLYPSLTCGFSFQMALRRLPFKISSFAAAWAVEK
jgi:hypothetical protein